MRFFRLVVLLILIAWPGTGPPPVGAHELTGFLAVEGRGFANRALYDGQQRDNLSVVLAPEYYHQWSQGLAFTCAPFVRLDSADRERTHFDLREFNFFYPGPDWELRVGIGKVFWGATEFVHLVDIINQTDLVENIDGEDKLGQAMIQCALIRDWGVVDLFLLPGFRERTFPGRAGRLRYALPVDTGRSRYESGAGRDHVDFAIRYSRTLGGLDLGLDHFIGTGREPTLLPGLDDRDRPVLIPWYRQINQTGLDLQLAAGDWLYKFEGFTRSGQGRRFAAATGGFEYTLVRVLASEMDLGVLAEWAWDERGGSAVSGFQNDLLLGLRLAVNDQAGTELLAGFGQDLDSGSHLVSLEAGRRLNDHLRAGLEARLFFDQSVDDPLYPLRNDDFLRLELTWYF